MHAKSAVVMRDEEACSSGQAGDSHHEPHEFSDGRGCFLEENISAKLYMMTMHGECVMGPQRRTNAASRIVQLAALRT